MILRFIRWVLGGIILFFDRAFAPKSVTRSSQEQAKLDQMTSNFALYQYEACPFCVKVRRAIKRLGLNIELRDALKSAQYRDELVKNTGDDQVPCLRIVKDNGEVVWMLESSDIIHYLEMRVSGVQAAT